MLEHCVVELDTITTDVIAITIVAYGKVILEPIEPLHQPNHAHIGGFNLSDGTSVYQCTTRGGPIAL